MNYIKLLSKAYEKFFDDDRLNATHISLYMALFQEWNLSRFSKEFFINRNDIMRLSKIASKTSYHRCLVDLQNWGYINYHPSRNPFKSSKVSMIVFKVNDNQHNETGYDPVLEELEDEFCSGNGHHPDKSCTGRTEPVEEHSKGSEQVEISSSNSNKQENNNKLPDSQKAVFNFFLENGFTADEGKKFFEYYQDQNWKTGNGLEVRNWQALARSWMDRSYKPPLEKPSQFQDNLKTRKIKRYDQPL